MTSNSAWRNGGATLFLTTLTRTRLPYGLGAVLERLDAPDVEAHGGVELERAAARRRLGRAEHHADLLAQLVGEHAHRAAAVERARELAQGLAHEPRLDADEASRRSRPRARPSARAPRPSRCRRCRSRPSAPAARRSPAPARPSRAARRGARRCRRRWRRHSRVHRVLRVDERARPAGLLRLGEDVVAERRLTGRLRPEDLDDAPARDAADPEREVERERAGRDRRNRDVGLVAHAHDRALAERLLDLSERRRQRLILRSAISSPPRSRAR